MAEALKDIGDGASEMIPVSWHLGTEKTKVTIINLSSSTSVSLPADLQIGSSPRC